MPKAATHQAHSRTNLTNEQIETLREAGFTARQIAALPNVLRLSAAQIDLAVEIGAIPDYEEIPLSEMVQPPDDEIDFSDIPPYKDKATRLTSGMKDATHSMSGMKESGWTNGVVLPAKKNKRLISVRLDPDIADFFQMQGKGYSARINSVLRAYVDAVKK